MLEHVTRRRVSLPSGIEIALLDWGGSGPPLLMHHANGFCAAIWDATARALRDEFRVIAMDARGHGDSSKPAPPQPYEWVHFGEDVAAVARSLAAELGVPRLRAGVGNSFGGTALLLASQLAAGEALFEELILVDPVLPPPNGASGPVGRGNTLSEAALKRRAHWPSREEARAWFAGKTLFQKWEAHALDLYVTEGLRDDADGVALKCPPKVESAIFSRSFETDVGAALAAVETPTLFARAGQGYFPEEAFRAAAGRMPEGALVTLDAGHLAPMEASARVARLVREVLAQRSTG